MNGEDDIIEPLDGDFDEVSKAIVKVPYAPVEVDKVPADKEDKDTPFPEK